ncbi:MAG: tetratricopeptide repeat protein [Elusimicrobia bacterium]|nr:tetratricopeptide repeat protein [Elusimicrobiota bacterium]
MKKPMPKNFSKEEIDLIEMGKFYFISGKYDEAIEEFEKVIKINPKNADAYFNMGIVKEAKNDSSGAKKMYEKTLEIIPDHKTARKHLEKLVGL